MSKKPYYLTTAIAYTSGKPHIGNTYEIVLADAIVRYKRFQGYDVRFQTGTDEHGQKIELKAQEAGITPKEFVDRVSYIVSHHHTITGIDGIDYQIMIEADYLVNADESNFSGNNVRNMLEKVFKTETGKFLLQSMYQKRLNAKEEK